MFFFLSPHITIHDKKSECLLRASWILPCSLLHHSTFACTFAAWVQGCKGGLRWMRHEPSNLGFKTRNPQNFKGYSLFPSLRLPSTRGTSPISRQVCSSLASRTIATWAVFKTLVGWWFWGYCTVQYVGVITIVHNHCVISPWPGKSVLNQPA